MANEPVYETEHYRVVIAKLTGPADTPDELRLRYVVVEKAHPIIAGYSGMRGEAIGMALQAEKYWQAADDIVDQEIAKAAVPDPGAGPPPFPGLKLT